MLKNFVKIAIRNILRNYVYSFINIFGLAMGLCCALLIILWINDEIRYDKFHTKAGQLYQVLQNNPGDNGINTGNAMPLPLVDELKTNERDIAYVVATDWGGSHLLNYGEKRFTWGGLYAGEDFLKMFSFPLVKGDSTTALKDPSGIVLSVSAAKVLFGDDEAMGKIVRVDNERDLTVTGIMEDVPANSTFQFHYLMPFSAYMASQEWVKRSLTNWDNNAFQLYVELQPHADAAAVQSRIRHSLAKNKPDSKSEIILHPLSRWRLYSRFENGRSVGGSIEFVQSLGIVAGFLLIIACINFMNLATARSERRAREVGIRKTVGSRRQELILQFIGESMVVTMLAFLLAIALTELALPFYNALVSKKLSIPYGEPLTWIVSGSLIVVTGLIAGSYPAFYLSSFKAATVLKGKISSGKTATPRKVLVTAQFCFTIFHIIAAIVFYKQIKHGEDRYLGYDQENLVLVENSGDISKNYAAIKHELLNKGLAVSVTKSNSPVTQVYAYMNPSWPGKTDEQRTSFATIATEYDYTKTLNITLTAGRDFSNLYNDSTSMLLNQAAVDYMGLKKPLGETMKWNEKTYHIVGVFENVLSSPYLNASPMMVVFDPEWFADMTIRMPANKNISEMVAETEKVFKHYNPAYPFNYRFADAEFDNKFTGIKLIGNMAYVFSGLAIIISCLGLFGLAAFTAEQRSKEIGIRKVLGASVSHVMVLLSKDFTKLITIAFVLTAPGAWWFLSMWLQRWPYRIEISATILIVAGVSSLVLAVGTVSFQAMKAAIANPVNSLRNE